MAILTFQKPDKVVMLEATDFVGKFEFRPLEPGFATTVGNALRRILLSSLEGFAICTIKIAGVEHEFASVPGVIEDVTNIILNLKQVRFKQLVEEFETETVSVTVEGYPTVSTTIVDGQWELSVENLVASATAKTVTVSNSKNETITLKNVLIGEVWFCSGQSNMSMPIGKKFVMGTASIFEVLPSWFKSTDCLQTLQMIFPPPL